MLSKHRLAKPVLVLIALAGLAVALSACAVFKEGSLKLSQPGGIGSVRVHFELCTSPEGEPEKCAPNEESGQSQYLLAISVPKGAAAPATITAVSVAGGAPIVYTRNDQVAQTYSEAVGATVDGQWPPAGHEGVGYLSAVFTEEEGVLREWTVDADFGLPAGADGGSFAGPFGIAIGTGWRAVNETQPADRPARCWIPDLSEPPEEDEAICVPGEQSKVIETGTSDLKLPVPAPSSAYVGGKAAISFPLDFASTATTLPSFSLAATSTLPKATLALSTPTFAPAPPDPATRRSSGTGTVTVTVPKAKPGVYDVTLTATTPQGGSVSQVAKLQVTKPKIKLGGVKLNKAKGTAILSVKIPAAGTLTAFGKGLAKTKAKAKKAKTLKIKIKPNAKTKALLAGEGKAKVRAKITFKPTGAAPVVKSRSIVLKQSP